MIGGKNKQAKVEAQMTGKRLYNHKVQTMHKHIYRWASSQQALFFANDSSFKFH